MPVTSTPWTRRVRLERWTSPMRPAPITAIRTGRGAVAPALVCDVIVASALFKRRLALSPPNMRPLWKDDATLSTQMLTQLHQLLLIRHSLERGWIGMGLRKPSMDDVAAAAGVSRITVYRVLNGRGGVKPETEKQVIAAAKSLGVDRALN